MTGQLHVDLKCAASGASTQEVLSQLVGNIYATTPGNPSRRQVVLPIGWDITPAAFDLPAGRYVVEAGLPSGEILSRDVEIVDGETTAVQFDLTRSAPFDSHMLQYVVGNIEPSAVYHSRAEYPVPNSRGSQPLNRRDTALSEAIAAPPDAGVVVVMLPRSEGGPPAISELNQLREQPPAAASERLTGLLRSPGPPVPLAPSHPSPQSPILRLDAGTDRLLADSQGFAHRYQFLRVTASDETYLVTVPWPWRGISGQTHPVEVLLNLRQGPTGSPISVAVSDPSFGAGLGYLASGALDKAAVLVSDVESMLRGKQRSPLAAAAGGYVLVGTETSGEPMPWDPWLMNLRDWFPDLSDGAILWGARRLRTAQDQAELDEARVAMLAGYDRGLPVYTLGLTWLIDGLSAFPEDPACTAALRQVRQLCWQVDMREPFVVLRIGGKR